MTPIATPTFDADFMRGRITGSDQHHLVTAFSLFQCAPVVEEELVEMAASLAAVDMAASGAMGTTLVDTPKMQKLGGYMFPRTPTDG